MAKHWHLYAVLEGNVEDVASFDTEEQAVFAQDGYVEEYPGTPTRIVYKQEER